MKYNKHKIIIILKNFENKLCRRPVKRDSSNLFFLSKKYFGSWNKMMIAAGYTCKMIQKPHIPNRLTPNLYYLLGLLSTDGHIQAISKRWSYRVMFYTSEKEEKDLILSLTYRLFKYKASVRTRKTGFSKRPNYEIYLSSKKIADYLHSLGIPFGAKSYNLEVPRIISTKTGNNFWHYLRGVFDGDGSIIFSGSNNVFKISSGSVKFLRGLKKIMHYNRFRKVIVSRQQENVWELRINTKSEINRLHLLIYKNAFFFYPRKKIKWEKQYI